MKIRAENKVTILSDTLKEFFGDKMNLARIKFFGLFISALCKVQTVCFERLACSFDSNAKANSFLRRIQRFISEYSMDSDMVARFIFSLLPHKPPYRLVLDRTNLKFGTKNINIFTLGIVYKGVAFPILFHMMPKFGNSSTRERIDLMNRFIWLFNNLKVNQCAFYHKIVRVKGELCYLSASKIINRQNAPELQIIVSFNKPNEAQTLYKERWQIATI